MKEQPQSPLQRDIMPGVSVFAPARRFGRWLSSPRILRRFLIAAAWLITLIALFYGEEHWRGKRAWIQYRKESEARGDQLDLAALIPKPISDEQNFAATPFVKSWFLRPANSEQQAAQDDRWKDDFTQADKLVSAAKLSSPYIIPPPSLPSDPISTNNPTATPRNRSEGSRQFIDLVAWSEAFAAVHAGKSETDNPIMQKDQNRAKAGPAVLAGLKSSAPMLGELEAASKKPRSVYPIVYELDNPWGMRLPHLLQIKNTCRRLQLRACAELAAGDAAHAFRDVELILRMADSVKEEPLLISYLVRLSCLQIAIQAIWEGLAEQRWSDEQLKALQAQLENYNLIAELKQPLATERAAAILTVDLLQLGKYNLADLASLGNEQPGGGSAMASLAGKIVPSGWYYFERLNYCLSLDALFDGTVDPISARVRPDRIEANSRDFERSLFEGPLGRSGAVFFKHRLITALLLPALGNLTQKAAQGQTALNQGALACALERFRLANKQFPEKLDSLSPTFVTRLPNDVFNGEPFHYLRGTDGSFRLYSVGWNQKDDGGNSGRGLFDAKDGDWVWEYPSKGG